MRRIIFILTVAALCASCSEQFNAAYLLSGGAKVAQAATLSDSQIQAYVGQYVQKLDAENAVLPETSPYVKRVRRMTAGITSVNGIPLNFKVYKTNEVNAFACGDGSIRVYSGLMDVMNDEELVAIIGHELGHLVHQDTKNAMKKAYLAAAAVDVVAAAGNVGAIAASTLGDISQAFINAQFSQKQEYAADQYGFEFAISRGQSAYSMCNALNKLVELSGSSASSSAVAKMFSSHPNSAERAEKMKAAADKYQKK